MAGRQIGHRKSSLLLSARFPVVKWRSRSVAKSQIHKSSTKFTNPVPKDAGVTNRQLLFVVIFGTAETLPWHFLNVTCICTSICSQSNISVSIYLFFISLQFRFLIFSLSYIFLKLVFSLYRVFFWELNRKPLLATLAFLIKDCFTS